MKKTYVIVLISVIAIMLVCAIAVLPYALSVIENQNNLRRAEDQMLEQAFEYLEKEVSGFSRNEWKFAGGVMSGKDKEIEKQNAKKNSEEFVYPYSSCEFTFKRKTGASNSLKIVVEFEKAEDAKLAIKGYRFENEG